MADSPGGAETNRYPLKGDSLEEAWRKELEKLVLRQKEIIGSIRSRSVKPKGKKRKLSAAKVSQTTVRELNRELREVNEGIARCKAYLGEPKEGKRKGNSRKSKSRGHPQTHKKGTENPKGGAGQSSGNRQGKERQTDEKLRRQLSRSKYDVAPGTWIHVWRG